MTIMGDNEGMSFTDKAKQHIREWKGVTEDLHVQLNLGVADAKDEFENQKKNLSKWVNSATEELDKTKSISKDKAQKLKSSLESLRVQVALGKAETEDALKDQQQNIDNNILKLKQYLSESYDSTEENINYFVEGSEKKLDEFHARFDLFKLQFHLGKEESKQEWVGKKKEIADKLRMLADKLELANEVSADKLENFSKEMSESWKHVKSAFKS
jgi:hypothetical protein